jgi:HAD superfamily hydrolase (TIGR01509 family)
MIRAVLFDFDGLILDTETAEFQSWQETYREYGQELDVEVYAQCIGRGASDQEFKPIDHLQELLGHSLDINAVAAKRRKRNLDLIDAQSALPGVTDYIDTAKLLGLRVGLASSSPRSWVSTHLNHLELLDRFDTIRTADDVVRAKPYPELYLRALADLQVSADEAIALEDSPNGVAAAVAAGIYTVWVPNSVTRLLDCYGYDLRLDSLADLPLADLIEGVAEPMAIAL